MSANLVESLRALVEDVVQQRLAAERDSMLAELLKQLREMENGRVWKTPSQVRKMAGCGMGKVFEAIKSGDLIAHVDDDPSRARPGIPSKRYKIRTEDARRWAESRLK